MTLIRNEPRDVAEDDSDDSSRADIYMVAGSIEPAGVDLADVPRLVEKARSDDGFVWVHLVDPDEKTIEAARSILGIHASVAADLISGRQQPKVQLFDGHLFVVLWSVLARDGSDDLVLGQTYLYIGDGWLLTLQRGEGGKLTDLPALLSDAADDVRTHALPAAHTIMAEVVDGYARAAADVESDLQELEDQVFSDSTEADQRRIYTLRKDIGRIDRAVSSIAAALRQSTDHLDAQTVGTEQIAPYLYDLLDDAAGTAALINNQSRGLDALVSSHENSVAARQNKDMRTISSFAALLGLPTLIAGLYGMNFKNIPLVSSQVGWIVIAGVMVVIDLIIYRMFKRRRWL